MQHQDKGRVFMPDMTPPAIIGDREPLDAKMRREAEALRERTAKSEEENFAKNKKVLAEKFQKFVEDNTNFDLVNKHPIKWMSPGFVIEVFVADFSDQSNLSWEGLGDLFLKYTSYAKVLSASPYNEGPKKEISAGEIVFLGDHMTNVRLNQAHEQWTLGLKTNQGMSTPEPIKYIRQIHSWIGQAKLYFPDKAKYVLTHDLVNLDEQYVKRFQGPFVFMVDPMDVKFPIDHNPFE